MLHMNSPVTTPHDDPRVELETDESRARWAAVCNRDSSADGAFYYSVRTTGVYCKPSCASRPALRKNVQFHESCAAAEAAGFRACKRCKPDRDSAASDNAVTVAKACRLIERAETLPSLDELAAEVGVSSYHFHRIFKAATGVTPRAYGVAHRAKRLRDGLAVGEAAAAAAAKSSTRPDDITTTYFDAGFNSSARFYTDSASLLGMTPSEFRRGGADAVIRFAVGRCLLGEVLVAATAKGICAILLGDDADALVRDLQDRFPRAELIGGDEGFESTVGHVIAFVDEPSIGFDLPLDVRGTAFQQRVWQALREIPAGSTASYTDVAVKLGLPKAVRAVAGACAANAIAVAIPCHRVVKSDGGLSGYRWGVERKRALLSKESGK